MPPVGRLVLALQLAACLITADSARATAGSPYVYVSPLPDSRLVSPHHNVVIRAAAALDPAQFDSAQLYVAGAVSGLHPGKLTLSDDARTLVFVPERPFAFGERVEVRLARGPRSADGTVLPPLAFGFAVSSIDPSAVATAEPWDDGDPVLHRGESAARGGDGVLTQPQPHSLPPAYPVIDLSLADAPESGAVFMTPSGTNGRGNLLILDNLGIPIFYRSLVGRPSDFRMLPNGRLVYFNSTGVSQYYLLDSLYAAVDSFKTGNGYVTDLHDFLLLPGGHSLLMAYDPEPVRMDSVVPGGNPGAIVTGLVIQELDAAKNVVFEWRSWDHFAITDAVECVVNLKASNVDYVHGNALHIDHEGHILLSSRHMNEITRIDRLNGETMWRLGLNAKNNQFTFVGDTRGFSHQHDIRELPNGHLTLFDNGNCLSPEYSRALEYTIDPVNKVATLVWEYRDQPDTYGRATGNVQRRAGGGTMIDWGFASKVTDLHPDGSKSYELTFPAAGVISYRALRFPWETAAIRTSVDSLEFGSVNVGDSTDNVVTLRNATSKAFTIQEMFASSGPFVVRHSLPITLAPNASVGVRVVFKPNHPVTSNANLYAIVADDSTLVTKSIRVHGRGLGVAGVGEAAAATFELGPVTPTPSSGAATLEYALPRPARVRLTLHDLQGRLVTTLAQGPHTAGRHRLAWTAKLAPPGLYFLRYEHPEGSATRALILLR